MASRQLSGKHAGVAGCEMPRDVAARFLEAKRSNGLADDGRGQGRDIKDLTMKNPGPTSDDTLMKPAQDDLEDAKGPVNGAPSGL